MNAGLAASTLIWWQDAGVDTLVDEAPRDWLKPAPASGSATVDAKPAETLPDTLDAFRDWLAAAPLAFATVNAPRLAPAGEPAARLMVIVPMPAPDGGWFDGEAGPLFDRMLAAMHGLTRDAIYLAPLSPARPLNGQLDTTDARHLADIARHHVGLVQPRALLLFGNACAEALLGAPVAETRGRWHEVATQAGPVRTVATIRPEQIGGRPAIRKLVWEDLQLVMEELNR